MKSSEDKQVTFFEMTAKQRGYANRVLETIDREIDFSEAERVIGASYSKTGRPSHRVSVLLRVMILQHLYGLSDPQAENQLSDRLSFQRFAGLGGDEDVPDETTICRFRGRLIECGMHEKLLEILNQQLEAKGYIVKRTTLVDADLAGIESEKA